MVGFDAVSTTAGAGATTAVLDDGFDPQLWKGCPTPITVTEGQDLLRGDVSSSGQGTLVAALAASAAPGPRWFRFVSRAAAAPSGTCPTASQNLIKKLLHKGNWPGAAGADIS